MPSDIITEREKSAAQPEEPKTRARRPVSLVRYLVVLVLFAVTYPLMGLADDASISDQYAGSVGLKELPAQVNEWTGRDYELDEFSLEQLEPDDYLWRIYQDPNGIPLDFMVVYGHKKQTFHSPGFCLPGGGWQIVSKSDAPVDMSGMPVQMNLFHIQRDYEGQQLKQVVLYCFVQGDRATPSLITHNMNLLRARVLHERATGALVRVTVPVYSTEDVAVSRAKSFIAKIYPDLRKRIG